jgi:uncharacterized protein (TIGR03083 family)
MTPTTADWIAANRNSHDHLSAVVANMDEALAGSPSYDSEWSIGAAASHLGSQAEIFKLFLDAGLTGTPAPGIEAIQPIWDIWNAKAPLEQVVDCITANEAFVSRVEALSDAEKSDVSLDLFGSALDLSGLLAMRLSEHAIHTWDIEVAITPDALLPQGAVDLLVDRLSATAHRSGKTAGSDDSFVIDTLQPARRFLVTTGPDVTFGEGPDHASPDLTLPSEAMIRLVYGRLDTAHAPADLADDDILAKVRAVFPGF